MRKAFVHVGMPKTGTTAIQKALSNARQPLRRVGLLYPGDAADHAFLICGFHPLASHHFHFRRMGISPDAADRMFRSSFERLQRDAAEHGGDVLFSTEYLYNMGEDKLRALRASMAQMGLDLHLVCYVRHPISQATSGIQQGVKMGRVDLAAMFDRPRWHSFLTPLKPALKVLGRDRIVVQSFDEAKRIGAERHILGAIGHADAMDLVEKVETNASLSWAAVRLVDAHNKLQKRCPKLRSVKRHLLKIGGPRFSLPSRTIDKIREQSQADVEWLEAHFSLKLKEPDTR